MSKDYNLFALQNWDMTDEEVVEEFDTFPMKLIHTADMNLWITWVVYLGNLRANFEALQNNDLDGAGEKWLPSFLAEKDNQGKPKYTKEQAMKKAAENQAEEEIISFTNLINSPSYQRLRSGNTDYFMLAQMLESMGTGKLTMGWTYLEASWEAECLTCRQKYVPYLNSAIHNFNLAVDESDNEIGFTYRLLVVELNRLKGDFDTAKLKLAELEANITPIGYEKIVIDFEKELINNQNSDPQELPEP